MPMSPRAAAPKRASVMAWASTSASEWPSNPNSEGIVTPPRMSGRPREIRWLSHPRPVRFSGIPPSDLPWRGLVFKEQACQVHIAGLGNLDIAVAAQHHADLHLQPLHQARFIG